MPEPADPIPLSALQHWAYCPRQCGLIHLEHAFDDNLHTLRGQAVHRQVDDPGFELRRGLRVERALPVWSDTLGLIGKADVVEFEPDGTPYPDIAPSALSGAQSDSVSNAYETAKAGGAHAGLLKHIRETLGPNQLRLGIRRFGRQITNHEHWIADPSSKPGVNVHPVEDVARWVTDKWPADIRRLTDQRSIYQAVLKEKEDGIIPGGP